MPATTWTDAVVYALTASHTLFHRLTADLRRADWEHQPCAGANSAAWVAGHLVLVDRRILSALGATDLPPLPDGFAERFGATKLPAGSHAGLADPAELVTMFDAHRLRLIEVVRAADPAAFDAPQASASGLFSTRGEACLFIGMHTLLHLGQVSTIRRSLGYLPVV